MSPKLHSSPPEKQFRSNFLKIFVHLEFFGRWAGPFENSREEIVEICWNCTLRVEKKKLVKKLFLKNLKFILFFQISRQKIYDKVVWFSFYVYRGTIWKKIYCEKIHKLSNFPDCDPKLFGLLDENVLAGLSKLLSTCLEKFLWGRFFCWKKTNKTRSGFYRVSAQILRILTTVPLAGKKTYQKSWNCSLIFSSEKFAGKKQLEREWHKRSSEQNFVSNNCFLNEA